MKKIILIFSAMLFIIVNVGISQDIINETGKDGKFIVRDAEQKEQLRVEDGNVEITGELKIETMPEGNETDAMVVWDREDKSLKVVPRVFSKVSPLSEPLGTKNWHSLGYDGVDEDGNEISASVQGIAAVKWNVFNTDYGYIKLGPANPWGAHIYTNKTKFFFNKDIRTLTGKIGSHNTNLHLKTKATTRIFINKDSGNVGIGDVTPTFKLDVAGKIGINDTQILYLPNQATYEGTIILGNGGGLLNDLGGTYDGQHNIAIGMGALEDNTTGYDNIFIGHTVGQKNIDGHENTFIGWAAGKLNISGSYNSFYGNAAGIANQGNGNVGIGDHAGGGNIDGNYNTTIGTEAGVYNKGGSNNTLIGYEAGSGVSNHTKEGNIFIGYQAGKNETGSNKLYIENTDSATPLLGGDFSTDRVGINTATPGATLEILGTDAVIIPVGTNAERPGTLVAGMIRFNSTSSKFEGYTGSTWVDLH